MLSEQETPILEVNSLSAQGTNPLEIMRTEAATSRMINNMALFAEALKPIYGDKVTASLHFGRKLNLDRAVAGLGEAGIRVTSLDTPDTATLRQKAGEIALDFLFRRDTRFELGRVKNHIGWHMFSVDTQEDKIRAVRQTLETVNIDENDVPFIIRTSTDEFTKRNGLELARLVDQKRKAGTNTQISVEINATDYSPGEYLGLYFMLRQDLRDRGLDENLLTLSIDAAHIAESKYIHHRMQASNATDIVSSWLEDNSIARNIAAIELNQYKGGEVETHADMLQTGDVNLLGLATNYGAAERAGRLGKGQGTRYIVEAHPGDFQLLITDSGIAFFESVLKNHKGVN